MRHEHDRFTLPDRQAGGEFPWWTNDEFVYFRESFAGGVGTSAIDHRGGRREDDDGVSGYSIAPQKVISAMACPAGACGAILPWVSRSAGSATRFPTSDRRAGDQDFVATASCFKRKAAAGPEDAGFCPVMSRPSLTT